MGLLADIRKFLSKVKANPVKSGIVAFVIWKIIKDSGILSSKEQIELEIGSLRESIMVKGTANGKELIYDTISKQWAIIHGHKILFTGEDEQEARRKFKKYSNRVSEAFKMKKNIVNNIRLEKLHRKVCKEEFEFEVDVEIRPGKLKNDSEAKRIMKQALLDFKKILKDKSLKVLSIDWDYDAYVDMDSKEGTIIINPDIEFEDKSGVSRLKSLIPTIAFLLPIKPSSLLTFLERAAVNSSSQN